MKSKGKLKPKFQPSRSLIFTFILAGGEFAALPPVSYATATNTLNID